MVSGHVLDALVAAEWVWCQTGDGDEWQNRRDQAMEKIEVRDGPLGPGEPFYQVVDGRVIERRCLEVVDLPRDVTAGYPRAVYCGGPLLSPWDVYRDREAALIDAERAVRDNLADAEADLITLKGELELIRSQRKGAGDGP